MIIILLVDTGDSERQPSTRPLRIIAPDIDGQRIETRRAKGSCQQENVSFAECERCSLTGDWYACN